MENPLSDPAEADQLAAEASAMTREEFVKKLSANPRFKIRKPSGKGFVIAGARPSNRAEFVPEVQTRSSPDQALAALEILPKAPILRAMENPQIFYGNFDGQPSRYDAVMEAWVLDEPHGKWYEINAISHGDAVRELTKEQFEAKFPDAPPLPPEAFKRSARFLAALSPYQREVVWLALQNHPDASLSEAIEILDAAGL